MGLAHLAVSSALAQTPRVQHQHVDGAAPDQSPVIPGLLARVGLRNQQIVHIDAQLLGVAGVQGVLGVHKSRQTTQPLRLGDDLQANVVLPEDSGPKTSVTRPRGIPPRQGRVKADRTGRDHGNGQQRLFGAEPAIDLCQTVFRSVQGQFLRLWRDHRNGHRWGSLKCSLDAVSVNFTGKRRGGLKWFSMGL